MKSAIGYVRCSSDQQSESGLGLEAQKQRIMAWAAMKGVEVVAWFVDDGVSAGLPLDKRPAGKQLMAEARASKPVIVVAKFDRLFRSLGDCCLTIDALDKLGVSVVSIAEGFDTTDSNPFARAMMQIIGVFAELERQLIKQRTKEALAVKRNRGERISRYAPYGWDFSSRLHGSDLHTLVENPAEQEVRAWILKQDQCGLSACSIARELNNRGVSTKCGGPWRHSSVVGILKRKMAVAA